jgi:hypothetical protein
VRNGDGKPCTGRDYYATVAVTVTVDRETATALQALSVEFGMDVAEFTYNVVTEYTRDVAPQFGIPTPGGSAFINGDGI